VPSELRLTPKLTAPAITALRVDVAALLSAHEISPAHASDILLALTEAATNAARHSGSSEADVHVVLFDHTVAVTVSDDGVGLDLARVDLSCPPSPSSPNGRGLFLISRVMDSVEVTCQSGTRLRMTKRLSSQSAAIAPPGVTLPPVFRPPQPEEEADAPEEPAASPSTESI
jgi:serine/threonine-protein kinase RsbW